MPPIVRNHPFASLQYLSANILALAFACSISTPSQGQGYPAKPVRVVVPFAPGGASDFVARIAFARFADLTGQQALIDNRAGAGGNIGMEAAARAAADGYTIFFGNVGTIAINPFLFPTLAVKPTRDFIAVTRFAGTPGIMVAHPSFPAKTLKELIALAKKNPGAISYGSPGQGSAYHILAESFGKQAAINIVVVPYKGGAGPAVTGAVGGEIVLAFATTSSVIQFIKAGRLRGIATMTKQRLPALPDVPTFPEAGFPGIVDDQWQGAFVPRGTPPEVVERLNTVLTQLVRSETVRERLALGFADPLPTKSPQEFAEFVEAETKRWGQVIREVGVKLE